MEVIALIVLAFLIYFFPTIVVLNRNHRSTGAIFVVNLFLGWTLLGWVVALAWSFTNPMQEVINSQPTQSAVVENKKCPFCAEIIKAEAKICRYCGKDLPVEELNNKDNIENPLNDFDEVGNTPLMIAAAKGNLEDVKKLLNEGADPFIIGRSGMTAKARANNLGHSSVVKLLEEESKLNKET